MVNVSLQSPAQGAIMGMIVVALLLALTHFVSLRVSGGIG